MGFISKQVGVGATKQLYAVWTRADSVSVAPRVRAAAVAAPKALVPEWAVGTFYGWDEDSFATITVSADDGHVVIESDGGSIRVMN